MATNPKYRGRHQAERARLTPLVRGGTVRCARREECKYAEWVNGVLLGGVIHEGESWDLDHADNGHGYLGPSHSICNRGIPHRRERRRGPMKHSRVW